MNINTLAAPLLIASTVLAGCDGNEIDVKNCAPEQTGTACDTIELGEKVCAYNKEIADPLPLVIEDPDLADSLRAVYMPRAPKIVGAYCKNNRKKMLYCLGWSGSTLRTGEKLAQVTFDCGKDVNDVQKEVERFATAAEITACVGNTPWICK